MIAVAVTDIMKVTIIATTTMDIPALSDASMQSPVEYNKAHVIMNYDGSQYVYACSSHNTIMCE